MPTVLSNTKAVALLYDSAYFGYSDIEENGTWKWVNGETPVYSNWNIGEPSDGSYAMYYWKWKYTWNDGTFDSLTDNGGTAFICEWEDVENTDFVQVSLGGNHSAAITNDGSLYMWGENCYGQLGNGVSGGSDSGFDKGIDSSVPIKIMDNVASVSLGYNHSAAVTNDGSLYMWGSNRSGQLGVEKYSKSSIPIKILDNIASVSLGYDHSAAITKNGSLYLWGSGSCGALGNGNSESSYTPVKILDNVKSVSLGNSFSAAITEDDSLYMWGWVRYGQLGNGTKYGSSTPEKIM